MIPKLHYISQGNSAKEHLDHIQKACTAGAELVQLGLKNVEAHWERAENIDGKFDFVVSRAVSSFEKFMPWVKNKVESFSFNNKPNGILYLKGGDLGEEMRVVKKKSKIHKISDFYEEEFFETKKVVYVQWQK